MSKNEIKPICRKTDIVIQEYGTEILIYDLLIHKAFSLNETSALIWHSCDGSRTVSEISGELSHQTKSPVSEDLVWLAVEQLKRENLIENEADMPMSFEGLSRREVIRRVGLASLTALPVISTLVAPTAVHAQSVCVGSSGRALGCPCTAITQCQPPSARCCTNVPGDPRVSAPVGEQSTGEPCGVNCDCPGNTCCIGNICSLDTVAPGGLCTNSCQCIGLAICAGGLCIPT